MELQKTYPPLVEFGSLAEYIVELNSEYVVLHLPNSLEIELSESVMFTFFDRINAEFPHYELRSYDQPFPSYQSAGYRILTCYFKEHIKSKLLNGITCKL